MAPIRPTPRFFDGPGPDIADAPSPPNDQTADGEYLGHLARLPFGAPRPLVGAAERLNLTKPTTTRVDKRPTLAWQTQAWQSFEAIGEVHYAFSLLGAVMSRVNLYVGVVTQADQPPAHIDDYLAQLHENESSPNPAASPAPSRTGRTTNPSPPSRTEQTLDVARSLLDQLTLNIQGGVGGMLRQMGTNLSVAGEMYLVQTPSPAEAENPQWAIASTDELVRKGDHYALRPSRVESTTSPKARDIPLAADAFVARIWRSHPRWSREPDSSMLGVLDSCEQLIILQQALRSITRSRMAAGIIFIPEGITSFTSDDGQDSVEEAITRAAMTAVEDEASQTTVVPLVLKGPPDLGERIKWIPLGRQVDDNLVSLIDRTLERIMQGIDIPKDVVSGLANVRYAVTTDHEMLTRQGWRHFDDPEVGVGTEILTLNHHTGMSEWRPLTEINVHDVAPGETLLHLDSRNHHSVSTPEHRWPVVDANSGRRGWTTSAEGFTASQRIETAAPHAEHPLNPKYTDDFVRLVALYTSDGSPPQPPRSRRRWVSIGKVLPDQVVKVRALLTRLFGSARSGSHPDIPTWNESTYECRGRTTCQFRLNEEIVAQLDEVAPGRVKAVTEEFVLALTSAQVETFLAAMLDIGDGVRVGTGTWRFWQAEPDRLRAIELAAILSGRTVRRVATALARSGTTGICSGPQHGLTVSSARTRVMPYRSKTTHTWVEPPSGTQVFCPTTANHTWFARHQGTAFFTGNSNAIVIDDNLYRSHIEPLVLLVTDALTSVYLRPLLVKALNSAPAPTAPAAPATPTPATAAPLPPTPATPTGPAPVPATTTTPTPSPNGRPAPTLPPSTTPPNVIDRTAAAPQITVADLADPDHLINRVVIWADTSQVVTRPDRSQAANDGYDKRLLSADAWRAARGFTDSDAPTADELLQRLVLDRGQLSPDLVQTLLALVDPAFFAAQNQEAAKGLPSDISTLLLPGTAPGPSGGPPGQPPAAPTPETTAAERAVETTPDALRRRRDQAASTVESRTPGGVGGTPTPPGGSPAPIPKP